MSGYADVLDREARPPSKRQPFACWTCAKWKPSVRPGFEYLQPLELREYEAARHHAATHAIRRIPH